MRKRRKLSLNNNFHSHKLFNSKMINYWKQVINQIFHKKVISGICKKKIINKNLLSKNPYKT